MTTDHIQKVVRQHIIASDEAWAKAIGGDLSRHGIHLAALVECGSGAEKSRFCVVSGGMPIPQETAQEMDWTLGETSSGFLIHGDDLACKVGDALSKLAAAKIQPEGIHAVSAGDGHFGALLWVKAAELERASAALEGVERPASDLVDEASEDSFPASDAPSFAAPMA